MNAFLIVGVMFLQSVAVSAAQVASGAFEVTGTAVENCVIPYHPDEGTVIEAQYDALQKARARCPSHVVVFETELSVGAHCSGPWMALQIVTATGSFSCR